LDNDADTEREQRPRRRRTLKRRPEFGRAGERRFPERDCNANKERPNDGDPGREELVMEANSSNRANKPGGSSNRKQFNALSRDDRHKIRDERGELASSVPGQLILSDDANNRIAEKDGKYGTSRCEPTSNDRDEPGRCWQQQAAGDSTDNNQSSRPKQLRFGCERTSNPWEHDPANPGTTNRAGNPPGPPKRWRHKPVATERKPKAKRRNNPKPAVRDGTAECHVIYVFQQRI
jgi:hypothetical protein